MEGDWEIEKGHGLAAKQECLSPDGMGALASLPRVDELFHKYLLLRRASLDENNRTTKIAEHSSRRAKLRALYHDVV